MESSESFRKCSKSKSFPGGITTNCKKSPYFTKNHELCIRTKVKFSWTPPKSPFNLIQEELYSEPWKLLLATIFLNKTNGKVALPLFWDFLTKWPNPESVCEASEEDIATFLQPIGLYNRRARVVKRF